MLPKYLIPTEIYKVQRGYVSVCVGSKPSREALASQHTHFVASNVMLPINSLVMFTGDTYTYRVLTPYDKPDLPLRQRPKMKMYGFFSLGLRMMVWVSQHALEAAIWPTEKPVAFNKEPGTLP